MTQLRQRAAPQHAQHAGVGPLAARAAGAELALDEPALERQPRERRFSGGVAQAEARREIGDRERRVRTRVAQREVAERIANRLQQRLGNADGQRHAKRVAKPRRVLDGDEA